MRTGRVTKDCALVMDGYPRSGNSYARATFQYANGYDLPISTHAHSHRMPELGAKRGLPTIVLIRPPRDAIASARHFEPDVAVAASIAAYRRYYEPVLAFVDKVLVVPFADVITDMGAVINRCNERFGTHFAPWVSTPEGEAAVAKMIDDATEIFAPQGRFDAMVSRPSAVRQDRARLLADLSPADEAALVELDALYAKVIAAAN
ncbi:MAG: hypothetical protein JWQ77_879 [Jatrophihabitans sp.]|nr:hypothetical protein [Jatrophihabitans sp.]